MRKGKGIWMVEKIYLDMDGVLADFERGIRELCGVEPVKQGARRPQEEDLMWEKAREVGHFYAKLMPMPGAIEMFQKIYGRYGDKCEILTGIPKPRRGLTTAGEDKIAWVRRYLSEDIAVHIVFREEKKNYCKGKGSILIDDYEKNIKEWIENGSTGILHINARNTLDELIQIGVM